MGSKRRSPKVVAETVGGGNALPNAAWCRWNSHAQPLSRGRQTSFDIHPGGAMTVGKAYGSPLVIRRGHPGRQIFPRFIAVPVSVDDEISMHSRFLLQSASQRAITYTLFVVTVPSYSLSPWERVRVR